jgi:hypothetical protein
VFKPTSISIAAVTELPPPAVDPEEAAPPVSTVKVCTFGTVNISKF